MTGRQRGKRDKVRKATVPPGGKKRVSRARGAPSVLRRIARLVGLAGTKKPPAAPRPARSNVSRIAASGLFDLDFYRAQVAGKADWDDGALDTSEAGLIGHYLRHGAAAWLNPSRAFDTGHYIETHPRLARTGENPLLHHVRASRRRGTAGDEPDAEERAPAARPRVVAHAARAFLVPATIAPRNTTRYRAEHLVELVGEQSLSIIDPKSPPADFFAEVERGAIVILQRLPLTGENRDFVSRIRASAAVVAYDIDDQVFDPSELEDWRIRGLDRAPGQYAQCMALADHFLVSTTGLRDRIERRFRRPAHVVTNCLGREIVALSRAAPERSGPPFVLGYASGSHTHDEDLKVALPAIATFLRANPEAEFHAIGHMDFPEALQQGFGDRVRHRKAVPWRKLPAILAGFSAQIVPLVDCPFNRCKSHIRFLEAAAVGVPSIVSAVGESGVTLLDGVTGLAVPDDTGAWIAAMQSLHDDAALRQRLGAAARRFVLDNVTTDAPALRTRTRRIFDALGLAPARA